MTANQCNNNDNRSIIDIAIGECDKYIKDQREKALFNIKLIIAPVFIAAAALLVYILFIVRYEEYNAEHATVINSIAIAIGVVLVIMFSAMMSAYRHCLDEIGRTQQHKMGLHRTLLATTQTFIGHREAVKSLTNSAFKYEPASVFWKSSKGREPVTAETAVELLRVVRELVQYEKDINKMPHQ